MEKKCHVEFLWKAIKTFCNLSLVDIWLILSIYPFFPFSFPFLGYWFLSIFHLPFFPHDQPISTSSSPVSSDGNCWHILGKIEKQWGDPPRLSCRRENTDLEHLFIYGSGRTLMSQLWSVEAVNIIINIMPDQFTEFHAFQRSCHLSFKNLGKQMYLYFFNNHPLKVPIRLSMPTVFSRFIALYCCLLCHLHCLNFEEVP